MLRRIRSPVAEVDGLGPQAGLPALHASATTPATTRLALAVVAVACAVLALWLAMHHPLSPPLAVAGVLLLAAAQARWPGLWLVALPALLPWLGLAPWSGWLLVEETDLAVLAVAAGGWLHWSLRPARQGLAGRGSRPMLGLGLLLLALWAVLVAVAAQRGVVDAGGWTFGWWQGYREPMNALRLAKPTLVVLLLLPLWCQLQHENQHAADLLTAGMTVSLAGTAMWCLWERAAFPGLLNAATDYRSTGPFWEAHVGGAALDVWLALTLPFALRQMSRARSPWALAAAGTAVLLGIYAALTTFSRIVYLALPVGVVLMLWLQAAQAPAAAGEGAAPAAHAGAAAPGWTSALALCAGVGALAHWLFPLAGYRGLLALLGNAWVLMLLLPRSANRPARAWAMVALAGVPAGLLVAAVALQFGKGAYWAYAVACVATTAWLLWLPQPLGQRRWLLASIGFVVQLACSVAVALHGGGPPAWPAAAAAAGCAMLAWLVLAQRQRSPWPASARWVGSTSMGLVLVAAAVSVFGAGDYMATRLGQTEADRAGRWQHWRDGLALVPNGTPWWLGSGSLSLLAFGL